MFCTSYYGGAERVSHGTPQTLLLPGQINMERIHTVRILFDIILGYFFEHGRHARRAI